VEEAARAGVKEAVIVVDLEAGYQVRQHFLTEGPLPGLEEIRIRPVVQEEPLGLGHAVLEAKQVVGDRSFFCLLADNIARPGADVLPALAEAAGRDDVSVVCLRPLSTEFLSRYGVIVPGADSSGDVVEVRGAIEKPGEDNAPSNLGLIGRYLFTPEIFEVLGTVAPGHGGEIQLTDAVDRLGREGRCRGSVAKVDLLDVGNPEGMVEAELELALDRFGPDFRRRLAQLMGHETPG
jgi:UTP--glucose-1-phosphate uridylyltransferase